jgi:hypothetical protein
MDQKPIEAALSPRPSGAHVIIRVFNTGEPVYATTALTSNQPHFGPSSRLPGPADRDTVTFLAVTLNDPLNSIE